MVTLFFYRYYPSIFSGLTAVQFGCRDFAYGVIFVAAALDAPHFYYQISAKSRTKHTGRWRES